MSLTTQAREALKSWYRRARARVSPNGEYDQLPKMTQAYIDGLVEQVRFKGIMQSFIADNGEEVYAYPMEGGRVAWGINARPSHGGMNLARGVFPAEQEMAG